MEGVVRTCKGGVTIHIRLKPRSSRNEIAGVQAGRLGVRVSAPPVKGAANAALLDVLSEALGVSKSRMKIVSGLKAREKAVFVEGLSAQEAEQMLSTESTASR